MDIIKTTYDRTLRYKFLKKHAPPATSYNKAIRTMPNCGMARLLQD